MFIRIKIKQVAIVRIVVINGTMLIGTYIINKITNKSNENFKVVFDRLHNVLHVILIYTIVHTLQYLYTKILKIFT